MAYVTICGFETGDISELKAASGSYTIDSAVKRTGSYSLKINTTGAASLDLGKPAANGTSVNIGGVDFYSSFYFRVDTASENGYIFQLIDNDNLTILIRIGFLSGGLYLQYLNGSGVYTQVGSTTAALTTTQQYLIEVKATAIATSGGATIEWKVGGSVVGTASSATVSASPASRLVGFGRYGRPGGLIDTLTAYFDDIAISDSAYPGAGQCNVVKPNGAGTLAQWTNGTASDYTAVDEVPHNSDTDYLMETGINGQHDLAMESSATGGIGGTIGAVKLHAIVRNVAAGAGSIALQSTSGGTAVTETAWTTGSTSYLTLEQVKNLDNAAAAWTSTTIDSLQVGVVNANANDARCTSILAMVWCTGTSDAQLVLSTIAATSTAAATVSTKAAIVPSSIAMTSTATATVSTPAQITPSTIAATSNATLSALSTPANLVLSAITAVSNATATVTTPSMLTLSVIAAVSTAVLVVSTPALLTLSVIAAIATVTLDLNLYVYPAGSSIQTAVAWGNSLYKPANYVPLRYAPMRFKPPRYRKPF